MLVVFSSDSKMAANISLLKEQKIDVIINLVSSKCVNYFPFEFEYQNYDISDNANSQILVKIKQILEFVEKQLLNDKRVFVHCYMGISRAPTIAMAFLMKTRQMNFDEAFDFVKSKVKQAEPNAGFLIQVMSLGTEKR